MCKVIIVSALLAVLVTVSYAQLNGWVNCGSPMADIQQVYLTNCDQIPCTIVRGIPSEISIDAIANHNNARLYYRVTATILGLPITLHEGTACNSIWHGECPINRYDFFRLGLAFHVGNDVPQISGIITVRVFSNYGEDQGPDDICITIPVQAFLMTCAGDTALMDKYEVEKI